MFEQTNKFGVEIELNSIDNRDFYSDPLGKNEIPKGSEEIALLLNNNLNLNVEIRKYGSTDNNKNWVIKPDRSCGIELCSPVLRNNSGLNQIKDVIKLLSDKKIVTCDERCSLHLHVDVSNFLRKEIANILVYWIKFEGVIIDSFPNRRKINKYCQCVSLSDLFQVEEVFNEKNIINKLGSYKYYTINCEKFKNAKRDTIEIRLGENSLCNNADSCVNWIKFVLWFVEKGKNYPIIENYVENNSWTGFCWLDLKDLLLFLEMDSDNIDEELKALRNWFLNRIAKNISLQKDCSAWSYYTRKNTLTQLDYCFKEYNIDKN
jgi:hypothetical protein